MKKAEYTHGGSVWKSLGLLLRGLWNLISFAAIWAGLVFYAATWGKWIFWGGVILGLLCTVCNLILPIVHLPKKR